MEIYKLDIVFWHFSDKHNDFPDKRTDIKSLPFLSIVQAKKGYYNIKIDDSPVLSTGEGGFFIAPSGVRQTITHNISTTEGYMSARWLFIDARINDKYTLDELFSFPIVLSASAGKDLNACFDALNASESFCDKMSILYRTVGLIIEAATSEKSPVSDGIANAVKYMHCNYSKKISVKELAQIANMSESNLYAGFKKIYSVSPLNYLNRMRLSVALEILISSSASIETTAAAVGICDSFYFSKLFKKIYGISPSAYRIQHSGNTFKSNNNDNF